MKIPSLLVGILITFFSAHSGAQVIVISDIDDTIQLTQIKPSAPTVTARAVRYWNLLINVFRSHDSFTGMSATYTFAASESVRFHYVSGAPQRLERLPSKFLQTSGFPVGKLWTRPSTAVPTKDFKIRKIREIMNADPLVEVILVGDNGEYDTEVYEEISNDPVLGRRVKATLIHDLYPESVGKPLRPGQKSYFTAADFAVSLHQVGVLQESQLAAVFGLIEQGLNSRFGVIRDRTFPSFARLERKHVDLLAKMSASLENPILNAAFSRIIQILGKRVPALSCRALVAGF
ncbi:MAG: App1 family protein [Bdellovibrionia bacterium]